MEINEDTHPTPAFTPTQRILGFVSLLAAFGFTAAATVLILTPTPVQMITITTTPPQTEHEVSITPMATAIPELPSVIVGVVPTLSYEARSHLLSTPIVPMVIDNPLKIEQDALNPFTIIPERPRNQMIKYTIQKGDTVYDIAQRFGISQEALAWSNDRRQLWTLIPGEVLNIPPVDGVYHQAVGSATIREIAALYQVNDPMIVVNSEANVLQGQPPDSVPPSGMWIFIPGGISQEVNWAPQIEVGSSNGTSGTSGSGNQVGFELGAPGSCGLQEPGIATFWNNPMTSGSYTITQGFSSWHMGIDLAASPGTPVYSANGGRVIFAGRSNWGYGLAVVISHGPFTTLYGHLSILNVSCGQVVNSGQQIAGVGSTGVSTGPRLHFEIMYNGIRSDPSVTFPF